MGARCMKYRVEYKDGFILINIAKHRCGVDEWRLGLEPGLELLLRPRTLPWPMFRPYSLHSKYSVAHPKRRP